MPVVIDVDGIPMSAHMLEAREPRAVIVALHGSGQSGRYFDTPGVPRLSLMRAGAALGFTVIAPDRPGFGSSAPYADSVAPVAHRIDLLYATVDRLLESRPRGAGVFLLGHSRGCDLAIRMACDERGADLLGLGLAGIGLHHHPRAVEASSGRLHQPGVSSLRDLLWTPESLYPAGLDRGTRIDSPAHDYEDAARWAEVFPRLAAGVRVPVHYGLGDHEFLWRSDRPAMAEVGALFTASPRVAVHRQDGGGHNLSLGRSALAYHLRVLSFVEECVLARRSAGAGKVN